MAKPVLTYENLAINDEEPVRNPSSPSVDTQPPADVGTAVDSELLRDVAHQTMMYLHADGVRALDEYALAKSTLHRKIKRHDLILEAIEEWAAKRGIQAQFRAKERKFKSRRRYVVVTESS